MCEFEDGIGALYFLLSLQEECAASHLDEPGIEEPTRNFILLLF